MVVPEIVPEAVVAVALMVAVPPATAVARPLPSILATNVLDELQMTCEAISKLVPSVYAAEAENCWVNPTWILGLSGVTVMEDRVAVVIVRVVLPTTVPEVAVMEAAPGAMAVAIPLMSTAASDVLDELQMTWPVKSWLVPSEYTPEAANCLVSPAGMLGLTGITDMEARVAEVTVRVVLAEIVPEGTLMVAVMVAAPEATAVARPLLSTVATDVFVELQVTCVVISWLVPSEYAPDTANCWVSPAGMLGLTGVTDMEDSFPEVTVRAVAPEIVPEAAVMTTTPAAMVVPRPMLLTVANDVMEEVQATRVVIS